MDQRKPTLMQRILYAGKDTSLNISCIPSINIAGAGNIRSILAYDVPSTEDVGLPTKFRIYTGDNFMPRGQKGHHPDTLAQLWKHVGPLSATLGQHYSNQNPFSSYYILNHKYNR